MRKTTAQDFVFVMSRFHGVARSQNILLRNRAKIVRRHQDVTEMTTGVFENDGVLYPDQFLRFIAVFCRLEKLTFC